MCHSPIMRMLGMVAWLITALASVNILTGMYNYNFLMFLGIYAPMLVIPMIWIIGVAGIISLVMFFKMVMAGGCCSECGQCPCNCK